MASAGKPFSLTGIKAVDDPSEFYPVFPVSCIFSGVRLCFLDIDFSVIKFGSHFASEKKSPTDANGSDGIEFIGVEENFCFESLRRLPFPKAVALDAVEDTLRQIRRHPMPSEDFFSQLRPSFSVTNLSVGPVFFFPTDVMEESSQLQNDQVRSFFPAESLTEFHDSLGVVPAMAPSRLPKIPLGISGDTLIKRSMETAFFHFCLFLLYKTCGRIDRILDQS